MTDNIALAKFKSTGSTTGRTFGDRFAEIINVKDYGAVGDGSHNDTPNIQAAFDAAFGSSGSPHGSASKTTNRPVFFPNGNYLLGSALTLTRVVGGLIFGAGPGATQLSGSGGAILNINGAANLTLERMTLNCGNTSSGNIAIDLNWDNTSGGDGLHDNVFRDLLIQSCNIGVRIANAGNGGANNLFQAVTIANMVTGIDAKAASAVNNIVMGGGGNTFTGQLYWCSSGQIHVFEPSIGASSGTVYGVRVDANFPVCVIGGRIESCNNFLKVTTGLVTVRAFDMATGTEYANITGGKVTLDNCLVSNGGTGQINGTGGTLYIRGCSGLNAASITAYMAAGGSVPQNF